MRPRLLGLLALTLASVACSPDTEPERRRPNIVLITVDTLRRDHLSCYGYKHRTTPFLDGLAADGVRFDRAYSTSSWTLPAIVSLLTGIGPATHGIRDGDSSESGEVIGQQVLGRELVLLSELLRGQGYQTFGLVANDHLQEALGFARGFGFYRSVGFESGDALDEPLREIRRRIEPIRPYFLWVHYFDPHTPYDSNRPELLDYLEGAWDLDGSLLRRVQSFVVPEEFLALDPEREPAAVAYARASYDSDIRSVDLAIERLFDLLEIGSDDLVVVTADHGEEFYEHREFGHGHSLFEELLRVPLIVRLPGNRHAGRVIATRVSLIDVLPTLLDLAGVEQPRHLEGSSLLPLIEDGTGEDRDVHASTVRREAIESLIVGRWKYIQPLERPGEDMLFDLERDASERVNVIASRPVEARAIRDALVLLQKNGERRREAPETLPVPPERLRALRSLGYLR